MVAILCIIKPCISRIGPIIAILFICYDADSIGASDSEVVRHVWTAWAVLSTCQFGIRVAGCATFIDGSLPRFQIFYFLFYLGYFPNVNNASDSNNNKTNIIDVIMIIVILKRFATFEERLRYFSSEETGNAAHQLFKCKHETYLASPPDWRPE